jgi:hypothetical protein
LIGFRQDPALTGKVVALGEVRLIIIWATIVDIQAHSRATEDRGQADGIFILSCKNVPELAREVGAIDEVWLVVVWAAIENV